MSQGSRSFGLGQVYHYFLRFIMRRSLSSASRTEGHPQFSVQRQGSRALPDSFRQVHQGIIGFIQCSLPVLLVGPVSEFHSSESKRIPELLRTYIPAGTPVASFPRTLFPECYLRTVFHPPVAGFQLIIVLLDVFQGVFSTLESVCHDYRRFSFYSDIGTTVTAPLIHGELRLFLSLLFQGILSGKGSKSLLRFFPGGVYTAVFTGIRYIPLSLYRHPFSFLVIVPGTISQFFQSCFIYLMSSVVAPQSHAGSLHSPNTPYPEYFVQKFFLLALLQGYESKRGLIQLKYFRHPAFKFVSRSRLGRDYRPDHLQQRDYFIRHSFLTQFPVIKVEYFAHRKAAQILHYLIRVILRFLLTFGILTHHVFPCSAYLLAYILYLFCGRGLIRLFLFTTFVHRRFAQIRNLRRTRAICVGESGSFYFPHSNCGKFFAIYSAFFYIDRRPIVISSGINDAYIATFTRLHFNGIIIFNNIRDLFKISIRNRCLSALFLIFTSMFFQSMTNSIIIENMFIVLVDINPFFRQILFQFWRHKCENFFYKSLFHLFCLCYKIRKCTGKVLE